MTLKCEMTIWISGILAHSLQTRQEEKVKGSSSFEFKYEITSLSGFILKIQNIFVLFNSSSIIEVMIKT